jgi:hypothetical protein
VVAGRAVIGKKRQTHADQKEADMTVNEAIERMIKLAVRRHNDGIPDHVICFNADGTEVPWKEVFAASPKKKQGHVEGAIPTPGKGYFCDILLNSLATNTDEERITFTVRSPTSTKQAIYVQPHNGAGYFAHGSSLDVDAETTAAILAIGHKL